MKRSVPISAGARTLLGQLEGSALAIQPAAYEAFRERVKALAESQVMFDWSDEDVEPEPKPYRMAGAKAVVSIEGVIVKKADAFEEWWYGVVSAERVAAELRQAAEDEDVEEIVIDVDSPGGMAWGTPDLAAAVALASESKRVVAHTNSLMASAAYWVASQADEIVIAANAEVGSIGAMLAIVDKSKALADFGLRVEVVRSGPNKGTGTPGLQLRAEDIAPFKENIEAVAAQFVEAVATGRGRSGDEIKALADGRTWVGARAVELGLVDRIGSLEELLQGEEKMSTKPAGAHEAALLEQVQAAQVAHQQSVREVAEAKAALAAAQGQLAAIQQQAKEKDALLAAKAEEISVMQATMKAEALKRAQVDGRVLPAMVETYQKMAASLSPELFSAALDTLKPALHKKPDASVEGNKNELGPDDASDIEKKTAARYGVSVEELRNADKIKSISNGKIHYADGTVKEVR